MTGLRLHPRTMPVQRAGAELGMFLARWAESNNLTAIEVCVLLTEQLQGWLKYPLRAERHPGNPDQKADEA